MWGRVAAGALLVAWLAGCSPAHGVATGPADAGQVVQSRSTDGGVDDGGTPVIVKAPDAGSSPSEIAIENALPGDADWALKHSSQSHQIEGYALVASAPPGGTVPIAVSTSEATSFKWVLYRLGHYDGAEGRAVASGGPIESGPQPACPMDRNTGVVACHWAPSLQLAIGADWVRGVYLLKLTREDGWQSYVPFVVEASKPAPVLVVIPTATWQAYNTWGGESLYDDDSDAFPGGRAYQVSFDRPYVRGTGSGDLLLHDLPLIDFVERLGLDVDYVTSPELDASPDLAAGRQVVLLSGHDEYWSHAIRDALDHAVDSGTSLMLLGANAGYWQVRYGPADDARPERTITCYKQDAPKHDPVGPDSPLLTVRFRDPPVSRPENRLFGVMFDGFHQYPFPQVVRSTDHWAFAGTGFAPGDLIAGAAGYEFDDLSSDFQPPGLDVLMDAPAFGLDYLVSRAQTVIRQQGRAWVFSAGGIDFVRALSPGPYGDGRVAQLVANVLSRALGKPLPSAQFASPPPPTPQGPFAKRVWTLAGVPGQPGDVDGPAGVGKLKFPVAVATLPDGSLVVSDAGAGKLKRIDASGAIHTIPIANMQRPAGVVADGAGTIYVADAMQQVIFQVTPGGQASVIAGSFGIQDHLDGPGTSARFEVPLGLALGGGRLLVADLLSGTIRAIDLHSPNHDVSTIAAGLYRPSDVAVGGDGRLLVVETGMARIDAISGGQLSVVAGAGPGFADGPASSALMQPFLGLATLPDGSLVVSDPGSYRIRRISGGAVSTLAGSGRSGVRDGAGDGADFVLPGGLTVDRTGTIYVADTGNGTVRAITR
jgi:hypothetical protein